MQKEDFGEGQRFPVWGFGGKIPCNQVVGLLSIGIRFAGTARRSLDQTAFFHRTPHCAFTHGDTALLQREENAIDSVVVVIWMLCINLFDFDQKQLPGLRHTGMRKAVIVPGLTDFKNMAHCTDAEPFSAQCYVLIQPLCFYRFRYLAKKPRASLRISFALRSSAISFISLRSFSFSDSSRRIPLPTKAWSP
jgi:hypothetical protein